MTDAFIYRVYSFQTINPIELNKARSAAIDTTAAIRS